MLILKQRTMIKLRKNYFIVNLNLDGNAFQDNCKRYSKMIEGDCYPCDIIEKKEKIIIWH